MEKETGKWNYADSLRTVFVKPFDGFRVLHAFEGSLWYLEFGVEFHDNVLDDWIGHSLF